MLDNAKRVTDLSGKSLANRSFYFHYVIWPYSYFPKSNGQRRELTKTAILFALRGKDAALHLYLAVLSFDVLD